MIAQKKALTRTALAAVLAASFIAAGCGGGGGGGGSLGSGVAANVAGEKITQTQLDEVISQGESRLKSQGQKIPPAGSQEYQAFQQNALQLLVQRVQFEQKAKELGVSVSDEEVDERMKRVLTQFFGGSQKKYEQALKKEGVTDEQVRDELRSTLLSEKIFKKVGSGVKVTEAEIRAYYDAHPELYEQKASRDVRHILVSSKSVADDLYQRLKGGADFAALAKKYSTDPGSKDVGGKLTVQRGQTVQVEDVAEGVAALEGDRRPLPLGAGGRDGQEAGEEGAAGDSPEHHAADTPARRHRWRRAATTSGASNGSSPGA